jgi:acetate kinase
MPENERLCTGIVERIGIGESFVKYETNKGKQIEQQCECRTYEEAFDVIFKAITDPSFGVIKHISDIDAVGHRVVHGGEKFRRATLINEEVIRTIEELCDLAPLHNPANLSGIKVAMKKMPTIPHIAVFDTSFFTTLPAKAHIYGIPYRWYEKYRVRRYGFHGLSHQYVSQRAATLLHRKLSELNMVTLHIGNGVSITAVKKGKAFDHSMGFTPLEGAIMGTRCGDTDPGVILYVMKKEGLSPDQMNEILNKKSGILGITNKYIDRRDLLEAVKRGDEKAKLAIEIECHRLKKYIGAYAAIMGGLDVLVFTAGVGENSPEYREMICEDLEFLGIKIDKEKNKSTKGKESDISSYDSKVKILVIPTNEEYIIAQETFRLLP